MRQVYNSTFVRWTTHSPKGLSKLDVEMAKICDSIAQDFGVVEANPGSNESCQIKKLADQGASAAGDCCVPKK